jgi:hypothetical protein
MDRRRALKTLGGAIGALPAFLDGARPPFGHQLAQAPRRPKLEHITALAGEAPARAEVRVERGGPRLFLNGREEFPFFALSANLLATARGYRDSGTRFFQPLLGLDDGWTGPGEYDWSGVLVYLDRLLGLVPDAFFLPRLHLYAPAWWKEAHPDEIIGYALAVDPAGHEMPPRRLDGPFNWNSSVDTRAASLASEKWRRDMGAALKDFLRVLERSPVRSRVLGYHIAGGLNGEWHYTGSRYLPDTGPAMARAAGPLPTAEERLRTTAGLLRDPAREAGVIRFYERFHDRVAETALEFCRVAKAATGRRVLVGLFYAYLLENVMIQEAGHLAPEKVLASPDVDFIACPYSYQHTNRTRTFERWESDVYDDSDNWLGRARGVGGDGGLRVLAESLRRHGKLFINEMDSSTYLEPRRSTEGGSGNDTVQGTLRILRRDLALLVTAGIGGWFYDFGHLDPPYKANRGWYDDPPMIREIRAWAELGRERPRLDISPAAEIAAVYDARSFAATAHWKSEEPWEGYGVSIMDFFNHWFCTSQCRAIHRIGAPVDFLYPFDLEARDARRYKLVLVPNLFALDAARVRRLRDLLRGSGATVVWLYAAGFVAPDRLDLGQMEALTGFAFERLDGPGPMTVRLDAPEAFGGVRSFGVAQSHFPRFAVRAASSGSEALGRWADNDGVAFATRTAEGWTSVYAGAGPLPAEVLRALAVRAGARLWSSRPDVVRATRDAAMIIATSEGERTLTVHGPLTPAFGGDPSAEHRLTMAFGDVLAFVRRRGATGPLGLSDIG